MTFAQKMGVNQMNASVTMQQAGQSKKLAEARLSFEELSITILIQFLPFLKCVHLRSPRTNVSKHNTPIHNILSTAPQLSISQKALGTLPEDGKVMPKHVGTTIHN
jgi:hypothetical protein